MNPLKSEVKVLTAESIGRKMEEFIANAQKKAQRQQGAKDGLEHAAKKIEALMEHVDKDIEGGIIDELAGEPLRIAGYAKKYIQRCVGVMDNLATTAEVSRIMAAGEEKGFSDANKFVNGIWQEEKKKLENFLKALEESSELSDQNELKGSDEGFGLPWKAKRMQEDENGEVEEEKTKEKKKEKVKKEKVKKKEGERIKEKPKKETINQNNIKSSLAKSLGEKLVKKKNVTKAS